MEGRLSALKKAAMLEEKGGMPRVVARQAARVVTKPASPRAAKKNQTCAHLPKSKAMRRHSMSDCVIGTDLPGLLLDNDHNKLKAEDVQNTANNYAGVDYSKWDAALERYQKEQHQHHQEADSMPMANTALPSSPRRQQRRCSTGGEVNDLYLLKNAKGYQKRDNRSKSTMSRKMSESNETSLSSTLKTKNGYYIRIKSRNNTLDDSLSSLEASMCSRSSTSSRIEDYVVGVGVGKEGGCASLGSLQSSIHRFQEDKLSNEWGMGSPTGVAGFLDGDVESNTKTRVLQNDEAKGVRTIRGHESLSSGSGIPRVPYPPTSNKVEGIKCHAPDMPLKSNSRAECLAERILSFQRRASCGSGRSGSDTRVPSLSTANTIDKPKRGAPSMPLTNEDQRVNSNGQGQQRRIPRRLRRSSDCGITHGRPKFVTSGSDAGNKTNDENQKSVYDNLVGAKGIDAAPRAEPRKGGGGDDYFEEVGHVDTDHRRGTGSHSQLKQMLQDHQDFLADVHERHTADGAVRAEHSAAKRDEARKDPHSTMGDIADAARDNDYLSMLKKVWYQPGRRRGSMSSKAKRTLRNGE